MSVLCFILLHMLVSSDEAVFNMPEGFVLGGGQQVRIECVMCVFVVCMCDVCRHGRGSFPSWRTDTFCCTAAAATHTTIAIPFPELFHEHAFGERVVSSHPVCTDERIERDPDATAPGALSVIIAVVVLRDAFVFVVHTAKKPER